MNNCTSTIISKLSETMDYLLGTCMPKVELDEDETSEALGGPKDDEYRKKELKQLVGMFASRAQNYIDCTLLSLESGKKHSSFYKLDNLLKTFILKTGNKVQEIPITNIKAILNYDDLQDKHQDLTKNQMLTQLSLNEKNRFVLIEVRKKSNQIQYSQLEDDEKLIILVEEVGNSDPFITVLRILKMYAETLNV